jgi:hypothetical protein
MKQPLTSIVEKPLKGAGLVSHAAVNADLK